MSAIAASFVSNAIKAICFAVIAYAGIIGGKKLRDKKDAEKALKSKEDR